MRIRTPAQQWIIDTFGDPVFDILLLACLIVFCAIAYMRPKWRAQDEAGHIAAEKKRQQLKQTQKS